MNLSKLTTDQILNRYQLPHRLLVYYTSQVAKDALSNAEKPDIRSLKAVEVAERFGNGESFTPEYLRQVREDAANAATNAVFATNAAVATYTAYVAAAYAATNAVASATNATVSKAATKYKDLLITLINTRLTEVERIIIFN